jgi:hypothetical protein
MPPDAMVEASEKAIKNFEENIWPKLSKEEQNGVKKFASWFTSVYAQAGYKTICRWIRTRLMNMPQ